MKLVLAIVIFLLTLAALLVCGQSPFASPARLAAFQATAARASVSVTNLVLYYKLDSTNGTAVEDSSGNGYNGLAVGTPSVMGGVVSNAFSFSGSGQWITNAGTPGAVAFVATNRIFSIAAWVYPNTQLTNSQYTVIGSAASSVDKGFFLVLDNRLGACTNAIRFMSFNATAGNLVHALQSSSRAYATNAWNHIVLTLNSNSPAALWVNGTNCPLVLSTNGVIATGTQTRAAAVGGMPHSTGMLLPMNGLIDELAIYKEVLTSNDVQLLWNGGAGNPNR